MFGSLLKRLGFGNLVGYGVARLWRGFRTGDQTVIATGAAALLLVWFRRPRRRELLYSARLERGESVVVDMRGARPTKNDTSG